MCKLPGTFTCLCFWFSTQNNIIIIILTNGSHLNRYMRMCLSKQGVRYTMERKSELRKFLLQNIWMYQCADICIVQIFNFPCVCTVTCYDFKGVMNLDPKRPYPDFFDIKNRTANLTFFDRTNLNRFLFFWELKALESESFFFKFSYLNLTKPPNADFFDRDNQAPNRTFFKKKRNRTPKLFFYFSVNRTSRFGSPVMNG